MAAFFPTSSYVCQGLADMGGLNIWGLDSRDVGDFRRWGLDVRGFNVVDFGQGV